MIDIKEFIKRHEGLRLNAYTDSLGIWTIGVGFNLERTGANDTLKKFNINPDMIWAAIEEAKKVGKKKTTEIMTNEQADKLLENDIAASVSDVKKIFPSYDSMPDNAKAVIVDLHFNMGGTTLRTFKNTIVAMNAGNWKLAADNLTQSKWYKQVGLRAIENVGLLRAI